MAVPFEIGRSVTVCENYSYNEDLRSNYIRYKEKFEEATRLTDQEQVFIENNNLEDKLNSIKFEFWKHVNSIVTSFFSIIKLLRTKREIDDDIQRIWSSKLTSTECPAYTAGAGPSTMEELQGTYTQISPVEMEKARTVSQLEDGMMRFKVGLIFSEDLTKTVQHSVFSVKDTKVLPGHSTFKMLEKEAKWFRKQKINLAEEIEKLKIHKEILARKMNLPCWNGSAFIHRKKRTNTFRKLFRQLRKMRSFEESMAFV